LLLRWDAPLVNDFFAMIFYGVLRKLTAGWCGDTRRYAAERSPVRGGRHDQRGTGETGAGTGGARRARPGGRAAADRGLRPRSSAGSRPHRIFAVRYEAYLEKFGDRCLEELKLESRTLHDDPHARCCVSIGQYARRFGAAGAADTGLEKRLRADAEKRVATALEKKHLRRWILTVGCSSTRGRACATGRICGLNAPGCLAVCGVFSSNWANGCTPRGGWTTRATSFT
jgi:hypothetical protein